MNTPAKIFLSALLIPLTTLLHADDETASRIYQQGHQLYQEGSYYDAAGVFEKCFYETRNPVIRANSLVSRMLSYRMCKLYYREFQAIEELLERYPEYVDCNALIAREFEIGKLFRDGFREPAFWIFRWIPYLEDADRTAEVYTAALNRAPYSKFAPSAHMQLAIHYDLTRETAKSLDQLRAIIEKHPASPENKYALLALANGLFVMAGKGDGDRRCIVESVELFKRFCDRYPDATEIEFARNMLEKAKDIQAAKLFEIAEFYRKNGRSEAAGRYLAQLMRDFPDSESAPEAEKILTDVSGDYLPGMPQEKPAPRMAEIKSFNIPSEPEVMLLSPAGKDSHFLLEVPDLKPGERDTGKAKGSEK